MSTARLEVIVRVTDVVSGEVKSEKTWDVIMGELNSHVIGKAKMWAMTQAPEMIFQIEVPHD